MAKDSRQKVESSTQAYLPISEIKEGVVVLNDKSLRAVIIVSSWGTFEDDNISINTLGENNAKAVKIFDLAGWK